MGFRYRKYTFRPNEVIEPTRLRDNMQALGHELNGNLDRENLPMKGITSSSITLETFNDIVIFPGNPLSLAGNTSSSSATPSSFQTILKTDIEVPVDAVIILYYSGRMTWVRDPTEVTALDAAIETRIQSEVILSSDLATTGEYLCNLRIRINGEIIHTSRNFSFLRKDNSFCLMGALPVASGVVTIQAEARAFRSLNFVQSQPKAFFPQIMQHEFIAHVKKR
tara:strand:+ start:1504 stop:2172 length:669 start_codon:yes stop_codon:yes gene_type:complete